jgi:hypothetical protein
MKIINYIKQHKFLFGISIVIILILVIVSPAQVRENKEWLEIFWAELLQPASWADGLIGILLTGVLTIVGLISLIAFPVFSRLFESWRGTIGQDKLDSEKSRQSYATQIKELSSDLSASFEKIDDLLKETQSLMDKRKHSLDSLESNIEELESREIELKNRVETLEKVPIQALDYFIKATESAEKKAARRDYSLFVWGMIGGTMLSTIVSLIFRALGWL